MILKRELDIGRVQRRDGSVGSESVTVLQIPIIELRGMALNGIFCADVLRPLDLVPLTDFTYKYHPVIEIYKAEVIPNLAVCLYI